MSTNTFKNNLTVGGSTFDKSKLAMRRPTPDSDVLASSDDDHDNIAPTRPVGLPYASGRRQSWLSDIPNRKMSLPSVSLGSQPATPSLDLSNQIRPTTTWNVSSFTASPSANRTKDVLPSPTSAHGPGDKSFGAAPSSETDDTVGFLLGQHGVRKSVRSQSYSVGQGDIDNQASRLRSSLRHRPSKPSLLGESAVGLGQLREDDIDEIESSNGSQQGIALPAGYWDREREQKAMVLKQVAIDNARTRSRGSFAAESSGPPGLHRKLSLSARSMTQNDIPEDSSDAYGSDNLVMPLMRRYSEHVGGLAQGEETYQGGDSQGWPGSIQRLNADALGRRHSFAHYGSNISTFSHPTLGNTQEEDEEASPLNKPASPDPSDSGAFEIAAYFNGFGPASRAINASAISAAHPAPTVSHPPPPQGNAYSVPSAFGRPGRRIYVVAFKCSRADIYYLYENTGLEIRCGDLVIVEGDRGHDLGQVTQADVSMEDAKRFKNEANDEHFRWLVMFSQYSTAGSSNKNRMLGALHRGHELPKTGNRAPLTGMGVQQDPDNKPRMIKRLAQQHEILHLRDKEGEEARAKRMATDKALDHDLPMEILDAEFQWDHHKISFFYYAEAYVDFKVLVTDLFKHYKIRIWMSAVNPASVVNPAGMQIKPPSGIGPGAIVPNNAPNASLSVGPLFGNNSYRSNEQQYGGRGRGSNTQGSYGDNYYPFSHQIPAFPAQNFQMQQWGQQHLATDMYGRYDPGANANRSPMNMGAWYPPATYAASPAFNNASSAASFRGGYPASAGPGFAGYSASGAVSASYAAAPPFNPFPTSSPGSSSTTGAAPFVGFDPDMLAAMATLSFK
ncbi:hypothetical protein N0V90_007199 [Kalmusia sp. IMI 367209]|nr:hypothetical protein N0V90_007199 [Kalmusia sp. IMI 367209]